MVAFSSRSRTYVVKKKCYQKDVKRSILEKMLWEDCDDLLPKNENAEFISLVFQNENRRVNNNVYLCELCLSRHTTVNFVEHASEYHGLQMNMLFFPVAESRLRNSFFNDLTPNWYPLAYIVSDKSVKKKGSINYICIISLDWQHLRQFVHESVLFLGNTRVLQPYIMKKSKMAPIDLKLHTCLQCEETFIFPEEGLLEMHEKLCKQSSEHCDLPDSLLYLAINMDILDVRTKTLKRLRYEYFLRHPNASNVEFSRTISQQANELLQDIPVSITGAALHYLTGKILNICVDYDRKCEESLDSALRSDSNNADAWLELGMCVWKKPDLEKALTCFLEALKRRRCPKGLCLLSAAKRAHLSTLSQTKDTKERVKSIQNCIQLCKEALELRPDYPLAHYSLGNTYLTRFFVVGQIQEKDLVVAIEAYERAICSQDSTPFINADLHVNLGVALQYHQRYEEALRNYHRATAIEPHFSIPKEHITSLEKFLRNLQESVNKRGKISQRRYKEIIDSLKQKDHVSTFKNLPRADGLSHTFLANLQHGQNPNYFIVAAIVGIVLNDESIPYSAICADIDGAIFGLSVYNFSSKFSVMIGDCLVIPRPLLLEVKNIELSNETILNFRMVRVTNPAELMKNQKPLSAEHRAYTDLSIKVS
ncbi:tetratricopeptide repeat protein 5 OB fold domain-containing protein [Ditylenchus destructor]|uniref:Tetratricopeptide repeat protein 5 OB fold domain-containing protein n=1 Tax=Ditylenchus destructor TaxID=166010 RepID=A0AAD4NI88_9BILA|nr:tetratricopeptide repeat protein 5 OB fold domain-containing protein [Ditylenchus destructor]